MGKIAIRALQNDEWGLLKVLRLRALQQAPDAFGPTYADSKQLLDEDWQHSAARFASGHARMFIGWVDEDAAGLISAVRDRQSIGHLGAFWTDPRWRGTGLGSQLFDAAMNWLLQQGCPTLELSVTEGNEQAEAMYRRRGFTRSGRVEPLRAGSALRNLYMTRVGTAPLLSAGLD